MNDQRSNVLIISAGRRVKLLEGFQSAARRRPPGTSVFCADLNPGMSAACQAAERHFALPHSLDAGYAEALRTLCKQNKIGLVVPTIDTELHSLSEIRDMLAADGTQIMVSNTRFINDCADKRATGNLFHRLGISTPQIFDKINIEYPCFTKPAFGSSSIGARPLMARSENTEALLNEKNRIFMELVPADYHEVTIDMYYDRQSHLRCAVPRYRLETRAGEVSKGVTRRTRVYDTLVERFGYLEGARGCITVQVFDPPDDRPLLGLEINARFGGGFPLTLAAGADFPGWMIDEWLGGLSIDFFDAWEDDLLMLRYDEHRLVRNCA